MRPVTSLGVAPSARRIPNSRRRDWERNTTRPNRPPRPRTSPISPNPEKNHAPIRASPRSFETVFVAGANLQPHGVGEQSRRDLANRRAPYRRRPLVSSLRHPPQFAGRSARSAYLRPRQTSVRSVASEATRTRHRRPCRPRCSRRIRTVNVAPIAVAGPPIESANDSEITTGRGDPAMSAGAKPPAVHPPEAERGEMYLGGTAVTSDCILANDGFPMRPRRARAAASASRQLAATPGRRSRCLEAPAGRPAAGDKRRASLRCVCRWFDLSFSPRESADDGCRPRNTVWSTLNPAAPRKPDATVRTNRPAATRTTTVAGACRPRKNDEARSDEGAPVACCETSPPIRLVAVDQRRIATWCPPRRT